MHDLTQSVNGQESFMHDLTQSVNGQESFMHDLTQWPGVLHA